MFIIIALVGSVLLTLLAGELATSAMLTWPKVQGVLPAHTRANLENLYFTRVRDNLQFNPAMARWDRELFYTLRPGQFVLSAREYSVDVSVNSVGVRDDEAALQDPQIIVMGDSFAMGYGVPQSQSFPKQLERLTGLKTLNMGVSSYGTVRERRLLDRASAHPRYVVIEYCDNDLLENAAFAANGNRYAGRSRAEWEALTVANANNIRYYPGKFLDALFGASFFANVFGYTFERPQWVERAPEYVPGNEAMLFLNALLYAGVTNLDGVQLVVFQANGMHKPADDVFLTQLATELRVGNYPPFLRKMIMVDLSSVFTPSSFFVLDDHWTVEGHTRVAARLAQVIH